VLSCLFIALGADVDPDANRPVPGSTEAVTAGACDSVRTDGCLEGMRRLVGVLEELELPCTFFWEARTLGEFVDSAPELLEHTSHGEQFEHGSHGLRHEDFTGLKSGIPLGGDATLGVLKEATALIQSVLGRRPDGFRAPYCRLSVELISALGKLGYRYDASLTMVAEGGGSLQPFGLRPSGGQSLWEVPLCRGKDRKGKPISSYLWQMFEGRRRVADYVRLAASVRQQCGGGLLQVALHPWHLCVLENGRRLSQCECQQNVQKLARLLKGIGRLEGVRFCTVGGYLAQWVSERCAR